MTSKHTRFILAAWLDSHRARRREGGSGASEGKNSGGAGNHGCFSVTQLRERRHIQYLLFVGRTSAPQFVGPERLVHAKEGTGAGMGSVADYAPLRCAIVPMAHCKCVVWFILDQPPMLQCSSGAACS
jgi:hypothetical protein